MEITTDLETLNSLLADKARLDFLQELLDNSEYIGRCMILPHLEQLHLREMNHPDATDDVREAIDRERLR